MFVEAVVEMTRGFVLPIFYLIDDVGVVKDSEQQDRIRREISVCCSKDRSLRTLS